MSEQPVPEQGSAIELVGVSKEYTSQGEVVPAVKRLDLTIGQSEFFSLLGPSGCGKTTTLRMIAGFEDPTLGAVLLYGKDVTAVPPNHRDVNMVFQNYALFPHMSVFDNIAFGLRRRKVAKAEVGRRVGELIELVELEGRAKRRPDELSGGQQQRVALARALVNRPRALLLDEPLGALDLKLRQAMQIELKRIQREVGITFVYVTHDQSEALTMSDRLVVMNDGVVEQLGTAREIYEQPASRFVAGFIGTSNILGGRVDRLVDGSAVLELGNEQRAVVPVLETAGSQDEVEFTVRPEKIELSVERPNAECAIRGTVADVAYLGTSTSYTVATDVGSEIVVFRQNAVSAESPAELGDNVWLSWQAQHSYALERSGQAPELAGEPAPAAAH
jgi:spermidine/putrescine transport system ATP-binding protein